MRVLKIASLVAVGALFCAVAHAQTIPAPVGPINLAVGGAGIHLTITAFDASGNQLNPPPGACSFDDHTSSALAPIAAADISWVEDSNGYAGVLSGVAAGSGGGRMVCTQNGVTKVSADFTINVAPAIASVSDTSP